MKLPIEIASRRRRANFDAHEIGQPVPGPLETLDSDEPWMDDHFTQENFEQLQDAQMDGELGPPLDMTRMAMMKKWRFANRREARFAEGDTAGFEKWLKTQPKSVQDDWAANKEKYGNKFKTAGYSVTQRLQMVKNGIDDILSDSDYYLGYVSVSDYSQGSAALLKASKYIGDLIKALTE